MVEYKKSYSGLVLIIALYAVLMLGVVFIPNISARFANVLILNGTNLWIAFLRSCKPDPTKRVGLLQGLENSGIDYNKALNVPSQSRKEYALKHFQRFGLFTAAFIVYSIISCVSGMSVWWDINIEMVGIIGVAFSTIGIKLE